MRLHRWIVLAGGIGCTADGGPQPADTSGGTAESAPVDAPLPAERTYFVEVRLDGQPAPEVLLTQPGTARTAVTDAQGRAAFAVDFTADGEHWLMAAHPEARVGGTQPDPAAPDGEILQIDLSRYDRADNPAYAFQHPGLDDWTQTSTLHCSHCHPDLFAQWSASPHRSAASNPLLWALYRGETLAGAPAGAAVSAGVTAGGGCADCHAPGIDGQLGGRGLEEAQAGSGLAYDFGVHCDVCHRVESVDMAQAASGVGGKLRLLRPSEPSPSAALGVYLPLTFGPWPDVLNPRMGAVYRPEFHEAEICGGCHQLDQPSLVAGAAPDPARWPQGTIPIHSTWEESNGIPCQSCHMPPDASVWNGATIPGDPAGWGTAAGWPRPPGSVRQHSFIGPRQGGGQGDLLALAAAIFIGKEVAGGELVAEVRVQNVGAGHAIPTGEPMRALLLVVDAACGGETLAPTGGDVLAAEAGALERRTAAEGWARWPGAAPGERLRVVRQGDWLDYAGFGPFGAEPFDGVTFTAEQKGIRAGTWAGEAEILAVDADGTVRLSGALPAEEEGYIAYRLPAADGTDSPGGARGMLAGAPGWMFARLLGGAAGERGVPHHLAVDVISDNRLMPGAEWISTHRFAATCADPSVRARLIHRDVPVALAEERGAARTDQVMAEVRR